MCPRSLIFGGIIMIRKCKLVALSLLGLCAFLFSSCAPPGSGLQSYAQVAAPAPGTARVWFVRTSDPQEFGDPIIFANGQQLGGAMPGVALYHDFAHGTYTFTVQSDGLTAGQPEGRDPAGTRNADLSGDLVGRQLVDRYCRGGDLFVRTLPSDLGPAYVRVLTDKGPPRAL